MRGVIVGICGLVAVSWSTRADAQTVLRAEPLVLAPYEDVLVDDASCAEGKILKVTGSIRGLRRRKACVAVTGIQASLGLLR